MTAPARRVVEDFIRALRATEVRVSPAEAIDAHRAAALAGWSNRTLLRDALCVTLAKSSEEVSRFEAAFDTFFARDALAGGRDQGDASNPQAGNTLEEQILAGDEAGLALAMEGAAAEVGAGDIQLAIQRSPLVRRMLDAMGLRALELSIQRRVDAGDVEGARELADGRRALFKRARAFIDRQSRLYAGESGRRLREAILAGQPFGQIPPQDIAAMTRLVKRLARRLADRYARRRRRALKGHLDARATLRRSLVHGGLPFDLVWKSRRRERPKLVAIVDVSRSVAAAAGFLLLFLHSLNEVVERLDAFAFSDRLVRVNDLLDDERVEDAGALILDRIGFRPTDYGRALQDYLDIAGDTLDPRTTVIVLGDGRSNFADPRLDLMGQIATRARSVIWLNPEPESFWGLGDSQMHAYRRFCRVAKSCNTLAALERIVEDTFRSYMKT